MSKNVLFVTEGSKMEPRFLENIRKLYEGEFYRDYSLFRYNTNLHRFIDQCFDGDDLIEEIDTIAVLKACRTSEDQSVLDRKFTDIFLVFDMDPHDSVFDGEKLIQLMKVFCESTDAGKLYINYPMMESLKHVANPWSCDYLDLEVGKDSIRNYKKVVGEEGSKCLKDMGKVDRRLFDRLVWLNLLKADIILGGDGNVPDAGRYETDFDLSEICRLQTEMWMREGRVRVLNTSVFSVIDFKPQAFLSGLIKEFGDSRHRFWCFICNRWIRKSIAGRNIINRDFDTRQGA
jgi:hypothetical protein